MLCEGTKSVLDKISTTEFKFQLNIFWSMKGNKTKIRWHDFISIFKSNR